MPYPLNNYSTPDAYAVTGEVVFSPPREACSMLVINAPIYYLLAPALDMHAQGASYQQEVYVVPGRYFFDAADFFPGGRVALMNVRSAVAGSPALVSIT